MVTKTEIEITDIWRNRGVEKDDCIGYMCALRKKKAQEEMLEWLKKNPKAKDDEISDKVFEIYDRE